MSEQREGGREARREKGDRATTMSEQREGGVIIIKFSKSKYLLFSFSLTCGIKMIILILIIAGFVCARWCVCRGNHYSWGGGLTLQNYIP